MRHRIVEAYKLAIKYNDSNAIRKIKSIELRVNKDKDTLADSKYIINYIKK